MTITKREWREYIACQLEDKRKTQAEICKVTVLQSSPYAKY
jgi:hypothetical protein